MTARLEIPTERFTLRALTEADVTPRYLAWLSDEDAKRFLVAPASTHDMSDLRRYVVERIARDDIVFLGIFDKLTNAHIGNIKYEPVNSAKGFAIMGILIGDRAFRGRGVAQEVLKASAEWLKAHRGVREILLAVSDDNLAGIAAYERVGFRVAETPHIKLSKPGELTMVWSL